MLGGKPFRVLERILKGNKVMKVHFISRKMNENSQDYYPLPF